MEELKIDLSSLQEVWAWDDNKQKGIKGLLLGIDVSSCGDIEYYVYSLDERYGYHFFNCEPYNGQDKKEKRPMTHAEIFKAISNGAVVRYVRSDGRCAKAINSWSDYSNANEYEICYNYNGDASDKWEKMEVEV